MHEGHILKWLEKVSRHGEVFLRHDGYSGLIG
jgi:hypothetical protein